MLKYVPNTLGILRIMFCIPLIFFTPFGLTTTAGIVAVVFYSLAGLSDIIDGPIARRIEGGQTEFGAALDGLADMVLAVVAVIFIAPVIFTTTQLIIAICALVLRFSSGIVSYIKHKQVVFLHTYFIKFMGTYLFALPFLWLALGDSLAFNIAFFTLMCVVILAMIEEITINLNTKEPAFNIKSIFALKQFNNQHKAGGE
ncbi:MAG: CDP-alcohol phosphatidyltransferase family protein [Firmicutes bacterium]|nr:CDP-alcohol phosphatidyltransferase family protein [Bacillota bacterium]